MYILFVSTTMFMGEPVAPVSLLALTETECISKANSLREQNPEKVYTCAEEGYARQIIQKRKKTNDRTD